MNNHKAHPLTLKIIPNLNIPPTPSLINFSTNIPSTSRIEGDSEWSEDTLRVLFLDGFVTVHAKVDLTEVLGLVIDDLFVLRVAHHLVVLKGGREGGREK